MLLPLQNWLTIMENSWKLTSNPPKNEFHAWYLVKNFVYIHIKLFLDFQ
jgi:hypothetical protein